MSNKVFIYNKPVFPQCAAVNVVFICVTAMGLCTDSFDRIDCSFLILLNAL